MGFTMLLFCFCLYINRFMKGRCLNTRLYDWAPASFITCDDIDIIQHFYAWNNLDFRISNNVNYKFIDSSYWHTDAVDCPGCWVKQRRIQLALGWVTVLVCLVIVSKMRPLTEALWCFSLGDSMNFSLGFI